MRSSRRTRRVISTGAVVLPGGDADRHHAATVADHLERLREGLRQAEHFERDVDAVAAGQLAHARHGVSGRGVDDVGGAQPARGLELVVLDVDRDDLRRAERLGDLDDVDADAAGGDDGDASRRRARSAPWRTAP